MLCYSLSELVEIYIEQKFVYMVNFKCQLESRS